jgi:hypothetical protein
MEVRLRVGVVLGLVTAWIEEVGNRLGVEEFKGLFEAYFSGGSDALGYSTHERTVYVFLRVICDYWCEDIGEDRFILAF